jgi:two-component system phosphate regulon response regulator PhoB
MDRRHPRHAAAVPLVALIDGDADTRELYAVGLAPFGFNTIAVGDGADAYPRVWETHPDVIVMEIALPHVDGWQLVQELRSAPRTRSIPIVVLTACHAASMRDRAGREHCDGFFVKPCLPEELARGLRDILTRS